VLISLWSGLGRGARVGLICGIAAILAATTAIAYSVLKVDYEVLFASLSPADAAAMVHELEQMKVPYKLEGGGSSILVDRSAVHQIRLKLMGKELPLHGTVGFELFNNSDFGMTEFAQRVNYQRALQGELTRTILSLAEVESVRVHLAFPEEGLFKREKGHAKASITLALHQGKVLRREQVRGIQRLVAAAIPGIESRDVTLVNERGIALTPGDDEGISSASSQRLELKREIEQHLAQKAGSLMDKAFGPGQAMVSVDVTLDLNQVRTTTEDVTTPTPAAGESPTGVVIRERETSHAAGVAVAGVDDAAGGTSHREVEYQVGRRVEQVVSSPGAISRLYAVAVVRSPLSAQQVEQIRSLVGGAVGATAERGDAVSVQSLSGLRAPESGPSDSLATNGFKPPASTGLTAEGVQGHAALSPTRDLLVASGLALAAIGFVIGWVVSGRRHSRVLPMESLLEAKDREATLAQIRAWLEEPPAAVNQGAS
jgi:flagellar M-ring protein FliF